MGGDGDYRQVAFRPVGSPKGMHYSFVGRAHRYPLAKSFNMGERGGRGKLQAFFVRDTQREQRRYSERVTKVTVQKKAKSHTAQPCKHHDRQFSFL